MNQGKRTDLTSGPTEPKVKNLSGSAEPNKNNKLSSGPNGPDVKKAKENKRRAIEEAHKSNPNHKNDSSGPDGPKQSEPKVTNAELGKSAGVSKSTVTRAKKVKAERTG